MQEYFFTTREGWVSADAGYLDGDQVQTGAALSDWLFHHGYRQFTQSHLTRCAVGHFVVWSQQHTGEGPTVQGRSTLPPFALEITQLDAEAVVWVDDLPALWDFLAKYGPIGVLMQRYLPGEEEEEEEDKDDEDVGPPRCPDCGEPLFRGEPPV